MKAKTSSVGRSIREVFDRHEKERRAGRRAPSAYGNVLESSLANVVSAAHSMKVSSGTALEEIIFDQTTCLKIETSAQLADYLRCPIGQRPPALMHKRVFRNGGAFSKERSGAENEPDYIFARGVELFLPDLKSTGNLDTVKATAQCRVLAAVASCLTPLAQRYGYERVIPCIPAFLSSINHSLRSAAVTYGVTLLDGHQFCEMVGARFSRVTSISCKLVPKNSLSFVGLVAHAVQADKIGTPELRARMREVELMVLALERDAVSLSVASRAPSADLLRSVVLAQAAHKFGSPPRSSVSVRA